MDKRSESQRLAIRLMNWRRIRFSLLIATVTSLVGFLATSWFVGSALIAPANRAVGPPPEDLDIESLTIASDSGASLAAWYLPAPDAMATVILVHPVRDDRRSMLTRARLLQDAGYSTLLLDLQAHGESPGEHVTAGYRERHDVSAAVDYVRSRNPEHKVGLIGWSLGGAAALLASPLGIDCLVLESVYPTLNEAVDNRVAMRLGPLHHVVTPVLLIQLKPRLGVTPTQLRPIDHISNVDCPVLVAAGDRDRHTTLAETKRLFHAAREPKTLVVFAGAAHTDLLAHDQHTYETDVVGFLDQYLMSPESSAPER